MMVFRIVQWQLVLFGPLAQKRARWRERGSVLIRHIDTRPKTDHGAEFV